jgi:hypothetical protein
VLEGWTDRINGGNRQASTSGGELLMQRYCQAAKLVNGIVQAWNCSRENEPARLNPGIEKLDRLTGVASLQTAS